MEQTPGMGQDPISSLLRQLAAGFNGNSTPEMSTEGQGHPETVPELLQKQCLIEAGRLTDEIIDRLSRHLAGENIGENIHERDDTVALVDAAKRAAEAGNSDAYSNYSDIYKRVTAQSLVGAFIKLEHDTDMHLAGIEVGDHRTAEALHDALRNEATWARYTLSGPWLHHNTELLVQVVTYCEKTTYLPITGSIPMQPVLHMHGYCGCTPSQKSWTLPTQRHRPFRDS